MSSNDEPGTPKQLANTVADLQPEETAAPLPELRFSGIDTTLMTLPRFGAAGEAVEAECQLQLEALQVDENTAENNDDESKKDADAPLPTKDDDVAASSTRQYRNTLCSIGPESAVKARLLEVGTDYDTEAEVNATFAHDQDVEAKSKVAFGNTLDEFYVWRRWKELFGKGGDAATLFASYGADVQADPKALERRPIHMEENDERTTHQRLLPVYRQGVLDDHFFLLALNAIITDSRQFSLLFASVEHLASGMATFRFFDESSKEQQFVTIDTLLPCSKNVLVGQPQLALGRTDVKHEFWLAFLQKAYATFVGSYAHLHRGSTCQALRHLTGADLTCYRWNSGRVNEAAKMDLWWFLQEAMRLNQPVVATCATDCTIIDESGELKKNTNNSNSSNKPDPVDNTDFNRVDEKDETQLPRLNWSNGAVVRFALDYDKSKEKTDYASIRERRLDPQVFHMIKVSTVFSDSKQNAELRSKSWSASSPKWNEVSRKALANPELQEGGVNEDSDSINEHIAWLTLDEFAAAFDTVVMVNNAKDETEVVSRFGEAVPCTQQEHALKLPHFLLSVTKPDDVDADNGEWTEGIDCNFKSIHDLKPNELDLGEETDDDVDNMSQSCTTTSSHRSSVVDVNFTSPNVLIVEATLSFPQTKFPVPFAVQAFRVPRAERQLPVKQIRDGVISYNLPVHSRVNVGELQHPNTTSFKFEVEVNTGFYNLVVVPERDIVEPIKFSLTVVKRQNAENYNVDLVELHNVTPT